MSAPLNKQGLCAFFTLWWVLTALLVSYLSDITYQSCGTSIYCWSRRSSQFGFCCFDTMNACLFRYSKNTHLLFFTFKNTTFSFRLLNVGVFAAVVYLCIYVLTRRCDWAINSHWFTYCGQIRCWSYWRPASGLDSRPGRDHSPCKATLSCKSRNVRSLQGRDAETCCWQRTVYWLQQSNKAMLRLFQNMMTSPIKAKANVQLWHQTS